MEYEKFAWWIRPGGGRRRAPRFDREFIEHPTHRFEDYRAVVASTGWPELVEGSGVPEHEIRSLARSYLVSERVSHINMQGNRMCRIDHRPSEAFLPLLSQFRPQHPWRAGTPLGGRSRPAPPAGGTTASGPGPESARTDDSDPCGASQEQFPRHPLGRRPATRSHPRRPVLQAPLPSP